MTSHVVDDELSNDFINGKLSLLKLHANGLDVLWVEGVRDES